MKNQFQLLHVSFLAIFLMTFFSCGIVDSESESISPTTKFEWPLKQSSNFNDYSYYYLSNHVDHDPSSSILDYNGGERSYDGHKGTDIVVYPFSWKKFHDNQVEVIAAASGVLIEKEDGHFDQNCSWVGGLSNRVKIEHKDGTTASYLHFKRNTVTTKSIGDMISVGEFLGYVGSSGNSDKPHLHFEVRLSDGTLIDPFIGEENPTTGRSWWLEQPEYQDSGINTIVIGSTSPENNAVDCPDAENMNEQHSFGSNAEIVFTRYYRHAVLGQETVCTVFRPDGSIWDTWNHSHNETGKSRYSWNTRELPSDAQKGVWVFEAKYEGRSYTEEFQVM